MGYIGYSQGSVEMICDEDFFIFAFRKGNQYVAFLQYSFRAIFMCELTFKCLREHARYVDSLTELPNQAQKIFNILKSTPSEEDISKEYYTIRQRINYPQFDDNYSVELFFIKEELPRPEKYEYFIQISQKDCTTHLFYVNQKAQVDYIPNASYVQIPENIKETSYEELDCTHKEFLKNFLNTKIFEYFTPRNQDLFNTVNRKSCIISPQDNSDSTNLFT